MVKFPPVNAEGKNIIMPIIQSAKKKMRSDIKKTEHNINLKNEVKALIKKMRQHPNPENLNLAVSKIDRAIKVNLFHSNKAARLKSRLSKLLKGTISESTLKEKPKTSKKTTPKK